MSAKLRAAATSDPGLEREINEDRVLCDPAHGIYAVIDGVGGESAGEVAAEVALEVLQARLARRTTDLPRLVREAIALANKQIYERAASSPRLAGMSCVLTVALLDGDRAVVGHVGDSRLYQLRVGEIRKLTHDHSPVGAREDSGEISEAEAMRHPRRNEIFRDVGSELHEPDDPGFIDILEVPFTEDSALLLCSDGLSDLVTSREIREIVEQRAGRPEEAVEALIERANDYGGKDNVSAVLVCGPRYAAARARSSSTATGELPRAAVRGAAHARRRGPLALFGRVLTSRAAVFLYGALAGLLALGALQGSPPTLNGAPAPIRVGVADGGLPTIGQALAKARPGQTVEVAPGTYAERIVLRDRVHLVSLAPRAAVLAPESPGGPAVLGEGVEDVRLTGFRIEGPLAIAVRLKDSAVTLENVEIHGASVAAVELTGADRSSLRASLLSGNGGVGVVISGEARPLLVGNLVVAAAGKPAIDVRAAAAPTLAANRFESSPGPALVLVASERVDEYLRWNSFGNLARDKAIRLAPPAGPAASTAPQ